MILFLSNADTELLAARSALDDLPADFGGLRWANPDRLDEPPSLDGVDVVVIRLLGGTKAWEGPFEQLLTAAAEDSIPVLAVGGEAVPDAELAARSTVPAGVVAEAHRYLVAGGPANIGQLFRFVSDTMLFTGFGFEPPVELPRTGVWDGAGLGRAGAERNADRPLVAVIFYRAHLVAGNTTYVADLCDAIEAKGGDALPIFTYSLRLDDAGEVPALGLCIEHKVDAVITSIFAAGATAGEDGDQWEVPMLGELDVPVIQAPASSRSAAAWADDEAGLSPVDVGMGVAIPEFDGRIIGPTFAFKEIVDDDAETGGEIVATRTDADRTQRLAGLAVRHAHLRRTAPADRKVVLVLSAYPTKRSRLGNAVGLDTPASAIDLLHALARAGHRVDRIPQDGDALMAELADKLTYDLPTLNDEQLANAPGRLDAGLYTEWFAGLPDDARAEVEELWGPAPGEVYHHDGELVFPGVDLGGVLVTIQPPRGFGADPIGTYHAPDMPPPHHYLGFYRWLAASTDEGGWGADAMVHLGKHGTLEWLPGKALALSSSCFPDTALGDLPLAYPFVVNDPGEGTQAKRRTHAVVIDHLPPPLTRADVYDDIARLEQLLDAYAQYEAMDPGKLPAIREQVWELLVSTEIHRDLELGDAAPDDGDDFDDMILHVDGYLCALKDAQIRGG
ncbi:MAG: cobaltochelatase subunit CobN, partial [Actinomycetota bacterium]